MIRLPLKVQVTQAHIDAGEPNDCGSCPQALALSEAVGAKCKVTQVFWQVETEGRARFRLPGEITAWIAKFDELGPSAVQPIEWTIKESDRL